MRLLWGPLLALVLLSATAQANVLRFEDAHGDQAPFPEYLDLWVVQFEDNGTHLAVSMQLAQAPPQTPSTVYEVFFESSTQGHNIGCFLGTSDPTELGRSANCFAYRHPKGILSQTTDYRGFAFRRDDANRTLSWTFALDTMAEPAGEELRLVRAYARIGVSDDRGGDIAAGDPQDLAASTEPYVMPGPPAPPAVAEPGPETPPANAAGSKGAPGAGLLWLGAAVALAAVLRKRR